MQPQEVDDQLLRLAEAVRAAYVAAVQKSYEEASMRGLCHEGAWEYAMGVVRTLDVHTLLPQCTLAEEGNPS